MNYIERLSRPTGRIDVVLDSDMFNEVDDQFAFAYLLKSADRLSLKAIYAAPFSNHRAASAKEGMEKSYDEILRILDIANETKLKSIVYKGSTEYLPNEQTPIHSEAAQHLVKLSKNYSSNNPLYVIAIGAISNIASALLIDITLSERIVVVWLGGNAHHWVDNREFNISQDVAAARVLFDSCTPLIQLPCMGVVSAFTTTGPELNDSLSGKNALCDYLVEATIKEATTLQSEKSWSRAIWDVTAVGWLLSEDFMSDVVKPTPIAQYDHCYSFDDRRHPMRYVYHINRDKLFDDLFEKLTQ